MIYVIDIDNTLCKVDTTKQYIDREPILEMVYAIRWAHEHGHKIILHTARGMRSFFSNKLQIELEVRPILEAWLKKHRVPYDELIMGKPWGDIYVDDRGLKPADFIQGMISSSELKIDYD